MIKMIFNVDGKKNEAKGKAKKIPVKKYREKMIKPYYNINSLEVT